MKVISVNNLVNEMDNFICESATGIFNSKHILIANKNIPIMNVFNFVNWFYKK